MPVPVFHLIFAAAVALAQPQSQPQPAPKETPKETQSQPADLTTRLDALDKKIAAIKDLTADFEQQKKTVLLKKPMVSSGTIKLKGAKTRWDTKKPHETVMTIDASEVRIYYPEQKTVEVYPIQGDMARLASSPLPRMATIREHFAIAEAKPADLDPKATGDLLAISLTPKTDELKEHIQRIRVLIDVATACARSVEITDADGDQTTITFSNVKLDSGLADKDVDLVTPTGTTTSRPLEGGAPKPENKQEDKK
jgi:outer membrane lipoprotein-sorting protein